MRKVFRSSNTKITTKPRDYGSCPKKWDARDETVVKIVFEFFGGPVPRWRKVFSMNGPMYLGDELHPSCEFSQLVKSGIMSPNQYVGVEINKEVFSRNLEVVKHLPRSKRPKLVLGDYGDILYNMLGIGELDAAVCIVDTMSEPKEATKLLAMTLDSMNHVPEKAMVVWNVVVGNRRLRRHYTSSDIAKAIRSNELLRVSMEVGGWSQYKGLMFEYDGTGKKSKTKMATFVFTKS